jgi:hypothetical protein
MAVAECRSQSASSISANAFTRLVQSLGAELERHDRDPLAVAPDDYMDSEEMLGAVTLFLVGDVDHLDARDLRFLGRLGVNASAPAES